MDSLQLIKTVVAELSGDDARVKVHEDEYGAVFEIFSINNSRLVGKHSATINALRTLSKALGYNGKYRIKVILRERIQET